LETDGVPETVTEKLESRRSTTGDHPSVELVYPARGTDSEMIAAIGIASRIACEVLSGGILEGRRYPYRCLHRLHSINMRLSRSVGMWQVWVAR
jgi:hypothetical protein